MKKIQKILIMVLIVLSLSGCTKYISGADKKNVKNDKTGQTLTANILCKPTDKDLLKLYEEHNDKLTISLEKLPACKTMKYNNLKYNGLWEALFVKPLALIIIFVGNLVKNYGLAVMIVGLLIRIILMPLTAKSMTQSAKMKEAQKDLARIEKKYENKTDQPSMMAKSEETMGIYKKHGINPFSSCLGAVVQLPLFFGFLEAINRVPAIFEGKFLSLSLGMTPGTGITSGNYLYIILILLIIVTTYFSFKQSMAATATSNEQQSQTKFLTNFMLIFISIASFSLPTAIALYWIVTNLFAVVQNYIIKREKM